ncbi:MAG: VOC family protein [Phycisphaerales bacterium]
MKDHARISRHVLFFLAALLGLVLVQDPHAVFAQEQTQTALAFQVAPIAAVISIGTTVSDLDRSIEFYTRVLSFEKTSETEAVGGELEQLTGVFGSRCRIARLKLGNETIELTQFLAPEGRPIAADSRSNDRWFQHIAIAVSDIDKAYAVLRQNRVRHASTGPQLLPAWNKNAGGISAFYFKDPDEHVLEIIQFPAGKGDSRWQAPTDNIFLGIDHTAIVVADTDRSVAFYRDRLGLRIAGESENYGTEQEHLNNVFGARLRITALRARVGPGIELLEYLAPTDGRDFPPDSRANDLWHWQVALAEPDGEALNRVAHATRGHWISPGVVGGVESFAGFSAGLQVKDPDGHALIFGVSDAAAIAVTNGAPQR